MLFLGVHLFFQNPIEIPYLRRLGTESVVSNLMFSCGATWTTKINVALRIPGASKYLLNIFIPQGFASESVGYSFVKVMFHYYPNLLDEVPN